MSLSNNTAFSLRWGTLWLSAMLMLQGCSREQNNAYVARVDQSVLTGRELAALRDSTRDPRGHDLELVESWITTELLYQEAVRRGLNTTTEIERQVEATRKRLAINALLDRELFSGDSALVTECAMRDLFDAGGDELRLREDVALISFARFSDRDAANDFRSAILRGASWYDALQRIQRDSLLKQTLVQAVDRRYVTKSTLYPEELWRLARNLNKEEVSFVVSTGGGYYILVVHGLKRQGEKPDWDYIKDELRERILIVQRKRLYDSLLTQLRTKHSVEVRLEPADSSTIHE